MPRKRNVKTDLGSCPPFRLDECVPAITIPHLTHSPPCHGHCRALLGSPRSGRRVRGAHVIPDKCKYARIDPPAERVGGLARSAPVRRECFSEAPFLDGKARAKSALFVSFAEYVCSPYDVVGLVRQQAGVCFSSLPC
jgi:hypothetical protein